MRNYLFLFCLLAAPLLSFDALLEGKVGYFIPTDSQFRNTYGEDSVVGSLEASFGSWRGFYPWVSAGMYDNSGHTHHTNKKTHLYFIPIGAGLKYLHTFEYVSIYGGVGVLPTYIHIHNYSSDMVKTQEKWGCGGVAKFGFIANRLWNFFLDLFAEYSYVNVSFSHQQATAINPVNLSNFTVGGGVGYWFSPCPKPRNVDED